MSQQKEREHVSKTSTTVKDRWNTANYDDIRIRVPNGQKAIIQVAADKAGVSLNRFVTDAVWARIDAADRPKESNEQL